MLIIKKGCISHDGIVYRQGQALPEMAKADQMRLLDLGVCVEGGAPTVVQETPQASSDLNINFSAEDAVKGKTK